MSQSCIPATFCYYYVKYFNIVNIIQTSLVYIRVFYYSDALLNVHNCLNTVQKQMLL